MDYPHSDSQEEETEPLCTAKPLTQQSHGESSSSENLHLVGDLKGGRVEVRCGDELEVVLNNWRKMRPLLSLNIMGHNIPYRIAGIDNFQQSELKISFLNVLSLYNMTLGLSHVNVSLIS